jgi:type II secretory pathway pseudopilin PulG
MKKDCSSSPVRRKFSNAFTLLEVLISSAILVIMMILLIGIADHTTRLWSSGEQRRNAAREVRAGMEMMTDDLHSAVITTNPTTFVITKEEGGNGSTRIFFLVSHPEEKRNLRHEGDLCATGYFIASDPKETGKSSGIGNLYRFHTSGDLVVTAYREHKLQELYDTASLSNSLTTELLARNIVKLNVRRIEENSLSDPLLMISLSALGDGKVGTKSASLNDAHLYRCTTFLRLPPEREQHGTNDF